MRRVLVANRGEIALRVVRACFDEGLESVVAVSAADVDSMAARLADRKVRIGPAQAADSYLSVDRIVAAAKTTGCDALHPGYGFLSERPELAAACADEGIAFVGPPADVMLRSGDKLQARAVAADLGVPTGAGSGGLSTLDDAVLAAKELDGFPLLLKASAGGGGRGMTIVRGEEDLTRSFETSSNEAQKAFGDGTLYLEPYVERARHVEVQLLADTHGNVVHLGERDCSTQRRYQKVVEEAPAVGLPAHLVEAMRRAAVDLGVGLGYVGAGTVEFLVDVAREKFVFLEINARVQVEHPVTEMVTGFDIVREQLRVAQGLPLSFSQEDVVIHGHALECRVNAEDPVTFLPQPGLIRDWLFPAGTGVRVDTHVSSGYRVPPYYDSLLAKVITHGEDRPAAIALMDRVLSRALVEGVPTTIPLHLAILREPAFQSGPVTTKWLEEEFL